MTMKWSKMDRIGPRICQNDDIGLNINFPLSKYANIWRNIPNMTKIDPKISYDFIWISYICVWFLYSLFAKYIPSTVSVETLTNNGPKSINMAPKIGQHLFPRPLEGSWEGSWGHFGPKQPQECQYGCDMVRPSCKRMAASRSRLLFVSWSWLCLPPLLHPNTV